MQASVVVLSFAGLSAVCEQTLQGRCTADRPGDPSAAAHGIERAEHRILTGPGSAFAKSQRGGPADRPLSGARRRGAAGR